MGRFKLEDIRSRLRAQLARERREADEVHRLVEARRVTGKSILADMNDAIVELGGEALLEDSDVELEAGSGSEELDEAASLPEPRESDEEDGGEVGGSGSDVEEDS